MEFDKGKELISQFSGSFGGNFPDAPSQREPSRKTNGSQLIPPHNLEAEKSVLGAILLQSSVIDTIRETGLSPLDFYREAHGRIFEIAIHLYDRREAIDLITMKSAILDRGMPELLTGRDSLLTLFDEAFQIPNVVHYARIVKEKAVLRKLIQTCNEITAQCYDGVDDLDQFLDESESKVLEVSNEQSSQSFSDLRSVILENVQSIENVALEKKEVVGLATGFRDFDQLTTGLHPGQVLIIGARPGMGKTSWFLSALQHASLKQGAVVALFSLEMSKEELGFRMLSGTAKLDSKNLKLGRLSDTDWRRLTDAADQLARSKIFIDDAGGISVLDIRARCRRLLSQEKRLDLIVIDYLQLMKGTKGNQRSDASREREISEISRGLKELAKELKVPIIALSQLSRSLEGRQDKRPMLSDLRESGSIEQDADMVCFIYRDDYYNKDSDDRGIAELILAKNRSGPQDTVKLAWLGQFTLFENLEEGHGNDPSSYR